MESQRVKILIEGYLRGWLDFKYPQKFSSLREELILTHIAEERFHDLLNTRVLIESVLRASLLDKSRNTIAPIFDLFNEQIRLKLPSMASEVKIENSDDKKKPLPKELSKDEIAAWKDLLQKAQAAADNKNNST